MCATATVSHSLHTAFLSILPKIERYARGFFGGTRCASKLQDQIAEVAALWGRAAAALVEAAIPARPELPAVWPVCAVLLPHARAVLDLTSGGMHRIADYLAHGGGNPAAGDLFQLITDALMEDSAYGPEHPDTLSARDTLAYFTGEALWTYLTMPFLYTWPGFVTEEIASIEVDGETWRRLKVTFPEHIKSHTRVAQLAIERAKRLVEAGQHVFILLDSITRTARAFNNAMSGGGRTMSGGIDARAMEIPRKIFAAARNTEEAGSLTIVATALIETGSRMDELIFQEFKGTGNMEMVLDRKISDQRIYPAIDIFLSGTRREELLLQPWELEKINLIRRGLAGHKPEEAIQRLLMFVKKFPTNTQMLKEIPG